MGALIAVIAFFVIVIPLYACLEYLRKISHTAERVCKILEDDIWDGPFGDNKKV